MENRKEYLSKFGNLPGHLDVPMNSDLFKMTSRFISTDSESVERSNGSQDDSIEGFMVREVCKRKDDFSERCQRTWRGARCRSRATFERRLVA